MKKIRVVVADDHAVMRMGIVNLFNRQDDLEVVGEAKNGKEALQVIKETEPDVIVLDMQMPVMDGVEVALALKKMESQVKILAFSAFNEKYYIISLLELGACGYLTKDEDPNMLVKAVRGIARGERDWLSPSVAETIKKDLE